MKGMAIYHRCHQEITREGVGDSREQPRREALLGRLTFSRGSSEGEELSEPNRDPKSQLCDKSEGNRAVQGKAHPPTSHIYHILFSNA